MDEIVKDERFSHVLTDPSFRRIPKNVRKTKVDNRFMGMLKNKKFIEKCGVDERGCSLNLDPSENLNKLYNVDESSSESENSFDNSDNKTKGKNKLKGVSKITKKGKEKIGAKKSVEREKSPISNVNTLDSIKVPQQRKGNKQNTEHKSKSRILDETSQDDETNKLSKKKSNNKLKKSDVFSHLKKGKAGNRKKTNLIEPDPRFIQENESAEENESQDSDNDNESLSEKKFESVDSSEEECESVDSSEEECESANSSREESENGDSSEEDSDDDSESDGSDLKQSGVFDHHWEEQQEDAPDTEEITRRLAVCNMDWDRIRAVDLYAVFNSFKPPDSSIVSVKIYPSEYGLERMEEEKLKGPRELVEKTLGPDEEEVEDKKGSKYHREKLRQYQMNRLKYFYAVVECDTPKTANTLYEQLNGMEYESSSVRFDLRFIPDDMAFDHEPTSVADTPELAEYKPRLFVTTALQQVKVGLTWDETDPQRREILQKAFTEPETLEKDIQQYLASSSGESEEELSEGEDRPAKISTEERIKKYKALLGSFDEQEKEKSDEKYEMEITWESGVKEKAENLVKDKIDEKTITPFEELQKKKKEKQKLKKKEKKAKNLKDEDSEDEQSDMSGSDVPNENPINKVKKISKTNDALYLISDAKKADENDERTSKKKKKKKVKQEKSNDCEVDVNDPRFSAIYTSPLFNVDPSDPHFKSTPGNLAIIAEKQRRLKHKNSSKETTSNKKFKYG